MSVDLNKKGLDLLYRINTNHSAHKWHRHKGEPLDRRRFGSDNLCDQIGDAAAHRLDGVPDRRSTCSNRVELSRNGVGSSGSDSSWMLCCFYFARSDPQQQRIICLSHLKLEKPRRLSRPRMHRKLDRGAVSPGRVLASF